MKALITFLALTMLALSSIAQAPEKMTYQAVVRDANDNLLTNQFVSIRVGILKDGPSMTTVFQEIHTLSTNANGLMSFEIGTGAILTGAISAIDWSNGTFFVKTEIDPTGGSNYNIIAQSQLLSVPYALHAKVAETANSVTITGNETAFIGWDKNEADDFDGQYSSLSGAPNNVSAFTNDAGYLTTEVDGSVTNELQALSMSNDTVFLSEGGFVQLPTGFDGQYSSLSGAPTNVSAFANDAGYLTTEVDSSVTNELQSLSLSGTDLSISNGNIVDLSPLVDDEDWEVMGQNVVLDSGNVGIGTNVPQKSLHIVSDNSNEGQIWIETTVQGGEATIGFETDSANIGIEWVAGVGAWNNSDDYTIAAGGSDEGVKMLVDRNGKVGIGTVSPSQKLDVAGNINVSDSILINNSQPIQFKRFSAILFSRNTAVSHTEYNAAIVGFQINSGSFDSNSSDPPLRCQLEPDQNSGNWVIWADLRNGNHEYWTVDVMFVKKGLSTRTGY